ncbi:MAG: hypothetical protein IKE25_00435 [Clostridia bacterium]|nr:hypothetical protein [Clostridia bacterium]
MANIQKKKATTYTYESVDGTKTTIQVGKDGVTQKWLALLMEDDAAVCEQDDVQRKHADYGYQNAVTRYERCPDDESGHPMDEIPDPAADIFRILYPEESADSPLLEKLRQTIGQLTDDQRDLIFDLYGMCKTNTQIGKEKNVTEAAIRCRRDKIHKRLKKLIES